MNVLRTRPRIARGRGKKDDRPTLTFLGGVGTVTGSKYLIEAAGKCILVDCGLFQGLKQLRLRNWAPLPVAPRSISAVVLTHAHIDHSGYLPLLIKNGFSGPVYCTQPTLDLCALLLPDSGFLHEKDADYANRHGFSKHKPALPLYTKKDAERALRNFSPVAFDSPESINGIDVTFRHAGHILGAAIIELQIDGMKIVFSGDLGRPQSPTMLPPFRVEEADYLIVESTYGDRRHDPSSPEDILAETINRTVGRGGTVLTAAFAVGRAQSLLYHLYRLKRSGKIRDVPIFVDSPMAIDATDIYSAHVSDQKLGAKEIHDAFSIARYVRDPDESKALTANALPKILISASGMATGGRILHHLKHFAPDPRNTILFSGFQAAGTRGAAMTSGAETVKIHGQYFPVRAEIVNLSMMSAHADSAELLDWLRNFRAQPRMTFITHGEPVAADTLRRSIGEELGWACCVPEYCDQAILS